MLRNYIQQKITQLEQMKGCYYSHKLTFQNNSTAIIYTSIANSVTLHNGYNIITGGGDISIETTDMNFGGIIINGNSRIANGGSGRVINAQYIEDISTAIFGEVNGLLGAVQNIQNEINQKNNFSNQLVLINNNIAQVNNQVQPIALENNQIQVSITQVTSDVEASKVEKLIEGYSLSKKAHILNKIWGQNDAASIKLKNLIIEKKFNPNHYSSNDNNLLKTAINNSDSILLKHLIDNGLKLGAKLGNELVIELIINPHNQALINTLFVNAKVESIETGLFTLTFAGKKAQLEYFLDCKPSLTLSQKDGLTLLQAAIKWHKYDIAKSIIAKDATTLSQVNPDGYDALKFALNLKDAVAIKLLKECGADLTKELKVKVNNHEIENIKLIVENAGDIDFSTIKDEMGNSILHLAASNQNVELMKLCLDKYPEMINASNNQNMKPLDYAQNKGVGNFSILEQLIPHDNSTNDLSVLAENMSITGDVIDNHVN